MTATISPRHEGNESTAGLGSFVGEPSTPRPPVLLLSSPSLPCSVILKLMQIRCSRQESTEGRREVHPSKVPGIRGCLQQDNG